jgi:hypothetical protein
MKIIKTAPDSLKILWKEKIFLKPKDVKTIEAELEKRGYNFTDKNLMMALKDSKFLTRKGEKGNYLYVQKYPYIEEEEDGNKGSG